MSTFLERTKELIGKSGITEKQLTAELGISNSSFTDWRKGKGKPSLETVVKISDYFHVSIDYLVRGKEFDEPKKLDFSNSKDEELLSKFHELTPELRERLLAYMDGMLSVIPKEDSEKRLSV